MAGPDNSGNKIENLCIASVYSLPDTLAREETSIERIQNLHDLTLIHYSW